MKINTKKIKKGSTGLTISLIVLGIIIIGLVVGVIINVLNKNAAEINEAEAELESLTEQSVSYLTHRESDIDIEEVESKLENIIEKSKDQDKLTQAAIMLSSLYGEEEKEVSVLKDLLNNNLDDKHRYRILSALLVTYRDLGKEDEYKETLIELVNLSDDMELEYEDWSMIKTMYKDELESLEEGL
ncbi:hypothetical protein IJH24_01965 [Candidatus Saccharibacteria bacterium]|nr:hypothetical protein [Candidatus Saccharibacteria bacterium]